MLENGPLAVHEFTLAWVADDVNQVSGAPVTLHRETITGDWHQRFRHTDFRSLYLTERGDGRHVIDDASYEVTRGDVYLMRAGSDHYFAEARRLSVQAVHFGDDVFDADTWATLTTVPGFEALFVAPTTSRRIHLSPGAYAEVASDLAELWAEWSSASPASGLLVRTVLLRLLVRLARYAAGDLPPLLDSAPATRHQDAIVAAALRSIELASGDRLRVRDLAAAAYLSPDRFTEVFASVTGRTPRDYIRHVRIERASTLLATTTIPISEIARTCGFRDGPHFSRTFRARTGRSPREFRGNSSD